MSVIVIKDFMIISIKECETRETGLKAKKFKKYRGRDLESPVFSDCYWLYDYNNLDIENGKTYKFELYLNSNSRGNLFLVIKEVLREGIDNEESKNIMQK